jgi:hypothetical protein
MSRTLSIALALAVASRVGTEQSGLYSESQVRGFDLNDSGAYRIDDAYSAPRSMFPNLPTVFALTARSGWWARRAQPLRAGRPSR